jgi:manganese/zinc/iron transport system permease protein
MGSVFTDNPNLWYVAGGSALLGLTSGALGCFAVLRRQSLLGDALAHAALPGLCLAFWLTGSKSLPVLLLGALAAAWLGALWVLGILRGTRLKEDAALGIVLSVFFGGGIVLLTALQHRPNAAQAGLDKFLFGQAAALVPEDLRVLGALAAVALAVLALAFKEFKLLAFDREFGAALGRPMHRIEVVLTTLLVVAVILGLQTVGVVLMAAMLIAPAVAARQWTDSLGRMVLLAGALGATSGVVGAGLSATARHLPTGPLIVLTATGMLGVSLALAPRRGLVWAGLRLRLHRRQVRRENLLADLYRLGEPSRDWSQAHGPAALAGVRDLPVAQVRRTLGQLRRRGWLEAAGAKWRLTGSGLTEARRVVRNHRLWELFLARRLDLAADHVHRDAEEMEHTLPPEVVAELDALLGQPRTGTHGEPIPRPGEADRTEPTP